MSAIITEKFRQHNARNFFESFSEASADVYYLFLGKATPIPSGTTGLSVGTIRVGAGYSVTVQGNWRIV